MFNKCISNELTLIKTRTSTIKKNALRRYVPEVSHTFSDWLQGIIWPRCDAHWEAEALTGVAHQRVLIKPDFSSFMSVTREIRPACTIYQTLIWKESLVRLLRSTQLGTLVKDHAADLVNNQVYNFLSIFLFKWWHCHCHFQILKYKVSIQFAHEITHSFILSLLIKRPLGSNLSQTYRSRKPLIWNTSRSRKKYPGNLKIHRKEYSSLVAM